MEDPLQDIGAVVHKLTQGSPKVQKETLDKYFTEDAAFYHPFCRVDSFPGSRSRVLGIFQWYKILSPKIELDIQSIAYDEIKQILYVTIHQIFSLWFLFGLHSSNVVLTTKLQLKKEGRKYYIQSQNDLYQTDQWIKFITIPWGIGAYAVMLWQWVATLVCVFSAHVFRFVTVGEQWYHDQGREQLKQARANGVFQLADESRETVLSQGDNIRQRISNAETNVNGTNETHKYGNMQVVDSK